MEGIPVLEPLVLPKTRECHFHHEQVCPVAVGDDTDLEPWEGGFDWDETELSENLWCNGSGKPSMMTYFGKEEVNKFLLNFISYN